MLRYSLCVAAFASVFLPTEAISQQYTMIDCGAMVGTATIGAIGSGGQAVWSAANVSGVGYSYTPYSYINSVFSNLSQTHGLTNTQVRGINGENVIVGKGGVFDAVGFYLKGNQFNEISIPPFGSSGRMFAYAISDSGDVALGYASGSAAKFNVNTLTGEFVNSLQSFQTAEGYAINDNGAMAGYGYVSAPGGGVHRRAAFWDGSSVTNLGGLSEAESVALGINNQGDIVGQSIANERGLPFIYRNGVMSRLAPDSLFSTASYSQANDINNLGTVVGTYDSAIGTRGFIWTQDGGLVNLQSLVNNANGMIIQRAFAINDSGWIVANGFNPNGGINHAILLAPVPEPTTIFALGSMLAILKLRRKRK